MGNLQENQRRRGSLQLENAQLRQPSTVSAYPQPRTARFAFIKYAAFFATLFFMCMVAFTTFPNSPPSAFIKKRIYFSSEAAQRDVISSELADRGLTTIPLLSVASALVYRGTIIPVYIDPGKNGVNWNPLLQAAIANPASAFTVVLNPNNGPNTYTTPDPNYKAGLSKLTSANPNIQFLGYVHQSYGGRSLADVKTDINTWATWSVTYGIALNGIFFDESPSDPSSASLNYVRQANTIAKSTQGFASTPLVTTVQNAGTLPPASYFAPAQLSDITIILEDTYESYLSNRAIYAGLAEQYKTTINAFAFALSSFPVLDGDAMSMVIKPMMAQAGTMFVTDLDLSTGDIYAAFGSIFGTFINAMSLITV